VELQAILEQVEAKLPKSTLPWRKGGEKVSGFQDPFTVSFSTP
jgi:hypothetical protein